MEVTKWLKREGQGERHIRLLAPLAFVLLQVAPDYMKPVRYDARKLQGLLGPPQMTSYDAGIGQTR